MDSLIFDEGKRRKRGKDASTNKRILGKSKLKNGKLDSHNPLAQPPICPECTSRKVWKDGLRYTIHGDVQRYLCRSCGYRFSQPKVKIHVTSEFGKTSHSGKNMSNLRIATLNFPFEKKLDGSSLDRGENITSHAISSNFTSIAKPLKVLSCYTSKRRVCVSESEAKNLSHQKTRQKQAAGATEKLTEADIKGKIIEVAWRLKKDGYSRSAIYGYPKFLRLLVKYGADLYDPESVKDVIANRETWGTSSKLMAVAAYAFFASINGILWDPPKYKPKRKLPFIPLESEIDALIASGGKKISTTLQVAKETAMRIGEICKLRWIDVDLERKTITVNAPEKGGYPRMLKISNKLAGMLDALSKDSERVFGKQIARDVSSHLCRLRKRVARKLQNPRLNHIHFHTLRHWKATMEYAKTRDILYVMKMLGHRNIQNTLIYTQLIQFESDEYHTAVAKTTDEARKLLEAGFEYVCTTPEEVMLFRKRK